MMTDDEKLTPLLHEARKRGLATGKCMRKRRRPPESPGPDLTEAEQLQLERRYLRQKLAKATADLHAAATLFEGAGDRMCEDDIRNVSLMADVLHLRAQMIARQ